MELCGIRAGGAMDGCSRRAWGPTARRMHRARRRRWRRPRARRKRRRGECWTAEAMRSMDEYNKGSLFAEGGSEGDMRRERRRPEDLSGSATLVNVPEGATIRLQPHHRAVEQVPISRASEPRRWREALVIAGMGKDDLRAGLPVKLSLLHEDCRGKASAVGALTDGERCGGGRRWDWRACARAGWQPGRGVSVRAWAGDSGRWGRATLETAGAPWTRARWGGKRKMLWRRANRPDRMPSASLRAFTSQPWSEKPWRRSSAGWQEGTPAYRSQLWPLVRRLISASPSGLRRALASPHRPRRLRRPWPLVAPRPPSSSPPRFGRAPSQAQRSAARDPCAAQTGLAALSSSIVPARACSSAPARPSIESALPACLPACLPARVRACPFAAACTYSVVSVCTCCCIYCAPLILAAARQGQAAADPDAAGLPACLPACLLACLLALSLALLLPARPLCCAHSPPRVRTTHTRTRARRQGSRRSPPETASRIY
jgi:hypothetical protein